MQPFPIITKELAHRIEQVDIDYTHSRLDGMQAAEGNPLGIAIEQFGGATAFLIRAWPDFWYGNRVLGLSQADENELGHSANFFGEQNLPFRIEIIPGQLSWALATRLHRFGFCQGSFSAALCGLPQLDLTQPTPAVSVHEVEPDELGLFLDLYQAGFELPRLSSQDKKVVRLWLERDAAHLNLYLAAVAGSPAGIAILYVKDGLGLLADAAVLPEFRGQGCQTALLRRRIEAAYRKRCELLTSFVEFGSTSHRNVERAGLRVAYTKALWWLA
ncbi:MAG: GNAT family N-acetyltransferase [Chloroflexi bacterium]|nr:GNAT family N-acetyltransferase [Chloroflexota bacterium]